MPNSKEIGSDLRKRIVYAHKAGNEYTKLSHWISSRNSKRATEYLHKCGKGRTQKIANTLERKVVTDVSKDQLQRH